MSDSIRWPDFTPFNMRLCVVRLQGGGERLAMVNGDAYPVRMKALGFVKSKAAPGLWLTSRWTDDNGHLKRFTIGELRAEFPELKVKETTSTEIQGLGRKNPGKRASRKPQQIQAPLSRGAKAGTQVPSGGRTLGSAVKQPPPAAAAPAAQSQSADADVPGSAPAAAGETAPGSDASARADTPAVADLPGDAEDYASVSDEDASIAQGDMFASSGRRPAANAVKKRSATASQINLLERRIWANHRDATGGVIRLMTDYDPGEDGSFPMEVRTNDEGHVTQVTLWAARPGSGIWYEDSIYRIDPDTGALLGGWLCEDGEISVDELSGEWEAVASRLVTGRLSTRDFSEYYAAAQRQTDTIRAIADISASLELGRNIRGEKVYESEGGRFVSPKGKDEPVLETVQEDENRFLRAGRPAKPIWSDLILCAQAWLDNRSDESLSDEEISQFAATVFGSESRSEKRRREIAREGGVPKDIVDLCDWDNDPDRAYGEEVAVMALEGVMAVRLHQDYQDTNGDLEVLFSEAQRKLAEQTPIGASALPLPLAVSMRRAMGSQFRDMTDCNAESPVFQAMLPPSATSTLLIQDDRLDDYEGWFDSINSTIPGRYSLKPFSAGAPAATQRMVASFTTGLTQQEITPVHLSETFQVSRRDHREVAELLPAMDDNGVAIFLIDGDEQRVDDTPGAVAGKISENSQHFFNWLYDHYDVGYMADLSPDMFSAGNPLKADGQNKYRRLVVINGRRPNPGVNPDTPNTVPVVHEYGTLWNAMRANSELVDARSKEVAAAAEAEQGETSDFVMGRSAIHEVNREDLQAPYVPMSKIGEATMMLPKNLATPTQEAFTDMADTLLARDDGSYQSVDDYVAQQLGMNQEEMVASFAPEQVDAVAMASYAFHRDRGMIIGDQTGIGKGRAIAGVARLIAKRGMPVVFLTERADLFQSIWRDIQDIGAENILRPICVNPTASIRDHDENLVDEASAARTEALLTYAETGDINDLPDNYQGDKPNLIMITYSQISAEKAPKAAIIKRFAEQGLLILDEAHKGAGDNSNTAKHIADSVDVAKNIFYSSATFAKTDYNLDLYRRVFPESVDTANLRSVIRDGGEPLQEVFASMLARDGVLLRREHDLAELSLETLVDDTYVQRNREYANAFATTMSAVAAAGERTSTMLRAIQVSLYNAYAQHATHNPSAPHLRLPGGSTFQHGMRVAQPGFGSRFHLLTKQLMLALCIDYTVDEAIKANQNGNKPLILLENTMEQLLIDYRDSLIEEKLKSAGLDPDSEEGIARFAELKRQPMELDGLPQYRELIRRMVDRSTDIRLLPPKAKNWSGAKKKRGGYIKIPLRKVMPLLDKTAAGQVKSLEVALAAMDKAIDDFPDLALSPIDSAIERLNEAGISCGELTARSLAITKNEAGKWVLGPNTRDDRANVMDAFNNGELEAAILNRSASSGADLHSGEKFADRRKRTLLEAQVLENVTDRMQAFGRVNRRGQVCPPEIKCISSGVPAQNRILAMQNLKLRRQNATTTSHRESAFLADTVDILNRVGDETCRRYLEANPTMARKLSLDVQPLHDETIVDRMGSSITSMSNLVTARMVLLPVDEQEALYRDLMSEYKAYIRELDNEGRNPLRARELPGVVKTLDRKIVFGVASDDERYVSEFDRPVYMSYVQFDEPIIPINAKKLERRISDNKAADNATLADRFGTRIGQDVSKRMRNQVLNRSWDSFKTMLENPGAYGGLEQALAEELGKSTDRNELYISNAQTAMKLADLLPRLKVGGTVTFSRLLHSVDGVITDISRPYWNTHMPQFYEVAIHVPGAGVSRRTVSELINDTQFRLYPDEFSLEHPLAAEFDAAKGTTVRSYCYVLDGNPFQAATLAKRHEGGHEPVVFTMEDGSRRRGMVLSNVDDPTKILKREKLYLPHFNLVSKFIQDFKKARLSTSMDRADSRDVFLSWSADHGEFLIRIPASKNGDDLRKRDDLMDCIDDFKKVNRSAYEGRIPVSRIDEAVAILYQRNRRFIISGRDKGWLNDEIVKGNISNHATYLRNLNQQRINANAGHAVNQVAQAASGP